MTLLPRTASAARGLQLLAIRYGQPTRSLRWGPGNLYDGAGHAFFYYQTPMYRPEAAMDGWAKVFSFFGRQLSA